MKVAAMVLVAVMAAVPGNAQTGTSLDCAKASNKVERTICGNVDLRDIKLVAKSGLLLRRDFYGHANLLQWFWGSDVKAIVSDKELGGEVLGFDEMVSPTPLWNGFSVPGMSIQFSWSERTGTGVKSRFYPQPSERDECGV